MIANRDLDYLFCSVQKAGSLSVRHWLLLHHEGKRIGAYHQFKIPKRWRGVRRFITVRNPYARMWSLYWWRRWRGVDVDFERMCRAYAEGGNSMVAIADRVQPHVIVHLERLSDELADLWFVQPGGPMPARQRITPKRPSIEKMTDEQAALIARWFAADFAAFGYRLSPPRAESSRHQAPRSES